ncbi:MAG: response regulator [Lachnospiraceae bacterium]|nr:response regulator [Lachnospiraceae bacterium]
MHGIPAGEIESWAVQGGHSGADGMALARKLRQMGDSVSIIFVTGNPDFALEGYDLEAVSYIVKPVKRQRLWAALDRARERIVHRAAIIVGRIGERGSHEELLERQGQYAGMWHAQAKYYVEQEPGVPVNSF